MFGSHLVAGLGCSLASMMASAGLVKAVAGLRCEVAVKWSAVLVKQQAVHLQVLHGVVLPELVLTAAPAYADAVVVPVGE